MFDNKGKLEKRRVEVLSTIAGEQIHVELMASRPRGTDDPIDTNLRVKIEEKLKAIEDAAKEATTASLLDDLSDDAELWGAYRGYLCPKGEVLREGELALSILSEWGIPKSITDPLRKTLGEDLKKDAPVARAALHQILEEKDDWSAYTNKYESTMEGYARWLFGGSIVLPIAALLCLYWTCRFLPLLEFGLLCAGVAGSCVSVMARMPEFEVRLSNELDAYLRRIWLRIGIGVAATVIGCAFLAWGLIPISVQGQTFVSVLSFCTGSHPTIFNLLILTGVPMLFGFSERALIWAEHRLFEDSSSKGHRPA